MAITRSFPFTLLASLALLSVLERADAFFILTHRPLIRTRLDPIVSPGQIASHEHLIIGGSRFDKTYNYTDGLQAQCTTAEVNIDKSSYWAPQLYWRNTTDGTYTAMDADMKTYYLQRPGSKNEKIHAFPEGLTMLAGNPNRRTYNGSSFSEQAISFVCLDYYNSHAGDPAWDQRQDFFEHNCPDGMRAQINFPQCWDGVRLSAPDQSHMAYPVDNVQGGNCPDTHPIHLVELFYEFIFHTGDHPFVEGEVNWVFANGDATGLSFHGDFINGWPTPGYEHGDILQDALDTCGLETGGDVYECEAFQPYLDPAGAAACQPELDVVDEPNGWDAPIARLPGNNPLWLGTGPKPSWPDYSSLPVPGFKSVKSTLPEGWINLGCIAEGSQGRALTIYETDRANLTLASCAAICTAAGLPYAGAEFSSQCFCGFDLSNGATTDLVSKSDCNSHCSGLETENCGGGNRLTLMYNPALVPPPPSLPAGWVEGPCWTEMLNGRTLGNASYSSDSMTQSSCVAFCASAGYKRAGLEYGRECYCGDEFAGQTVQADDGCNMRCSGSSHQFCGGGNRLSTFFNARKTLPPGLVEGGCIAEGTRGRALTAWTISASNMTRGVCADICTSLGFALSGTEYHNECYCGNILTNGATSTTVDDSNCSTPCAGDSNAMCGGPSFLSLVVNPALQRAPELPAGWSTGPCMTEATSQRALSGASTTSSSMTHELCIDFCSERGFSLAGVEYSSECYCSNTFGPGSLVAPDDECSMPCSGQSNTLCGGGNRLTTFKLAGSSSSSSGPSSAAASTSSASAVATSSSISSSPSSLAATSTAASTASDIVSSTSSAAQSSVASASSTTSLAASSSPAPSASSITPSSSFNSTIPSGSTSNSTTSSSTNSTDLSGPARHRRRRQSSFGRHSQFKLRMN